MNALPLLALLTPLAGGVPDDFGADLVVGKKPPPLVLDKLVQAPPGATAESVAAGPAVVEFWATWCLPCVEQVPHLNDLQIAMQGRALAFVAVDGATLPTALRWSGSAVFTLGYAVPSHGVATALVFGEAAIGLGLLALLIAYLPSIYSAFSRREATVTHLSVRAGTPPSAVELLSRAHRAQFLHHLDPLFETWESWFVDIEETHTTFVSLVFFRSPNPHRSWITAAGAMLDTAALRLSVIDEPFSPPTALCLRSGFLALRAVADIMGIGYDPDPAPDAPISIERGEFDAVCHQLEDVGLPLVADRDAAWRAFAGWRINYDAVLIEIARRLVAPAAPWSSDGRSVPT